MTSPAHIEILPPVQQRLWPALSEVKDSFVLYGGTAVALYTKNRQSLDFDFFSEEEFQPEKLLERYLFLKNGQPQLLQSQPDTLTVLVKPDAQTDDTVRVSFFGGRNFGCLDHPRETPDGVLRVASPKDLLAHKLKVLQVRVEAKDYQDIDALLSGGLDLAEGLSGAALMFREFSPQLCLKALTYFKDKTLTVLPKKLQSRLVAKTKKVGSLPQVALLSTSLSAR